MKLELLLDREPIGAITEQTLERVWGARYGRQFDVQWLPRGTATAGNGRQPIQDWICNARLNVIFLPNAPYGQFEPIRREFGRSLVAWRQPLQSAYLRLALHHCLAPRFACATLRVTPEVPDGPNWIIVPGNSKIRLLNRSEGVCLVAAKHGFPREALQRELQIQTLAASLELPVVPILEQEISGGWYLERYLSATPLNRLVNPSRALQVASQALLQLQRLATKTLEHRAAVTYAEQLAREIHPLIEAGNLAERFGLGYVGDLIERLVQITQGSTWQLPIVQSHGDFQPANLLVRDDAFWIIDWELSRRRQAAYDPLVFFLAARFPSGLAARMQSLRCDSSPLRDSIAAHLESTCNWSKRSHLATFLAIFLLEELQWRLEQLVPHAMIATGGSIERFLTEAEQWTRQQRMP